MADPLTYRTLAGPVVASIEERRSIFECWLRRAEDEPRARAIVEEARVTHWDARHHCSAFVLGADGATVRSNDDGEPAGTAGAPMLEALIRSGLTEVVAVVTRWFGGTLLGTGGLARAYADAVRAAVDEAVVADLILTRERVRAVDVRVGHDLAGRLEHDLRTRGVGIARVQYAEQVTVRVQSPLSRADALEDLLAELTSGQAHVIPGTESEDWLDLPQRFNSPD